MAKKKNTSPSYFSKKERQEYMANFNPRFPKLSKNHQFMDISDFGMAKFIEMLSELDNPDYEGFQCITLRGRKKDDAECMKLMQSMPTHDMKEFISNMNIPRNRNVYFTKSCYKKVGTWAGKDVLGFRMIAVDIDDHRNLTNKWSLEEREDNIARFLSAIDGILTEDSEIPFPNGCIYTGRGIQLIWFLHQASAKLEFMYRDVAKFICDRLENILKSGEFGRLQVDRAASVGPSRLCRLPGTYNIQAKRHAYYVHFHDVRMDLVKQWENTVYLREQIKRDPLNYYKNPLYQGKQRLESLNKLLELRGYNITEGMRNTACLIMASTYQYAGFSDDDAIANVLAINNRFPVPMRERALVTSMNSIRRKKYRYHNSTIIQSLGISQEEQDVIGLLPEGTKPKKKKNKHKKRDAERRAKKDARNKQILEMHDDGCSISQISRDMGITRNTVARVINENGSPSKGKSKSKKSKNVARPITPALLGPQELLIAQTEEKQTVPTIAEIYAKTGPVPLACDLTLMHEAAKTPDNVPKVECAESTTADKMDTKTSITDANIITDTANDSIADTHVSGASADNVSSESGGCIPQSSPNSPPSSSQNSCQKGAKESCEIPIHRRP